MNYAVEQDNLTNDNFIRDESLDFGGIRAGEGVNSIHAYPAMFHSRLVRQLIGRYSSEGDYILDPFMGSGVSAVESAVMGRKFIGFDINPLAVLIAKVRTTPIKKDILIDTLANINGQYYDIMPTPPVFPNINFWFTQERIMSISKIITSVDSIENEDVQRFYKITLSETIRAVSQTKPNEFKLVRRKKPCQLDTITLFTTNSYKNINSLDDYYKLNKVAHTPDIQWLNTLTEAIPLEDNSISLLITSPPYGDSQTTVAYGQFSRLSLQWLNLPYDSDKKSLGCKPVAINSGVPSPTLYITLSVVSKQDLNRAMHVFAFYYDMFQCLKKIISKIKIGGHIVFVVGNRTVKGTQLPTDVISVEMLESLYCSHIETRVRLIGNKRMPSKNSPTNITGEKAPTMKYEYIVVCKRDR
ncbi:MAG: site-specific DNA-methyltransferase [Nitrospirae bacterium]|nr:site-specific DNA-methyltransferase [Nitrospirota bacterium]